MKRCIVLLLALVAVATFGPARAGAATPCRDKIFNEWYHDGKIASTYPLSCYRDALKHIPPDVKVYSSLSDDIQLALQAAVDRSNGKSVPSEVGSGTRLTSSSTPTSADPSTSTTPSTSSTPKSSHKTTTTPVDTAPDAADPGGTTATPTSSTPVAASSASTSSNGVPLPVIVLGGVALVLVASGAIGLGVRRYRRGDPT
jgi:cobalamin biosynthesis Mg chelatase CobN